MVDNVVRLISEGYSPLTNADVEVRMAFNGPSIVRLMNQFLDENGQLRDFVLPILHFGEGNRVSFSLLSHEPNSNEIMLARLPTIDLGKPIEAIRPLS